MQTRIKAERARKEKTKKDRPTSQKENRLQGTQVVEDAGEETLGEDESSETMVNGQYDAADGEEDEQADEDDEVSPRGSKRARVNDEGEGVRIKSELKGKGKARPTMHPRDSDGYMHNLF